MGLDKVGVSRCSTPRNPYQQTTDKAFGAWWVVACSTMIDDTGRNDAVEIVQLAHIDSSKARIDTFYIVKVNGHSLTYLIIR